jgi:hypothetical protein
MNRALRLLSLLLAFQLMGGHWLTLQSIAWTKMTVAFAAELPLGEAVLKAVSGEAPCEMCKTVRTGQEQESKQAVLGFTLKAEALLPTQTTVAPESAVLPAPAFVPSTQRVWIARLHPPATPPPLA